MRIFAVLLAALLVLDGNAMGAGITDFSSGGVGTSGSEFLTIDVDPRGIAMGGAFASVTNNAFSMYWNPAGLSAVPRTSAGAMHNEYLAGIRLQYLSYAQRFNDTSVAAGAVRYMDGGKITNRDINGAVIGNFRPRSYVFELGWGQSILDLTDAERDISLGVNARFFHSDLIKHANGFGGDIGIQAHFTEAYIPYNFGAVFQNIGSGQMFDKVRDNLPFQGRLGASIRPRPFLLLALDGVFPVSNIPYGALGLELALEKTKTLQMFLRGGYNSRNQFSGLDGFRGLTLGFGAVAADISFDYAFVPFGILGNSHRFSVAWNLPAKHSRRYRTR